MIKQIIKYLPEVKAETENLKIAKGKFKLPETIKECIKSIRLNING